MAYRSVEPLVSELAEAMRSDALGLALGYNVMDARVYVCGHLPWENTNTNMNARPWTDLDDSFCFAYAQERFGCNVERNYRHALSMAAAFNSFDPVRQMIEALPEWDGCQRVGSMFHQFLGAADNEYTSQVECLLFKAGIARVYFPGVKFDHMVVLKGAQGIGKSSFCRLLALNPAFYTDSVTGIGRKEAAELIQGKWIVEISELAAMRNSQLETVKAFITRQSDDYRSPYAHRAESKPRRCILVGTTNAASFLTDATGNRRFLPVECGVAEAEYGIGEETSNKMFEQAWAEAFTYARAEGLELPPKLTLPSSVMNEVRSAQENSVIEDPRIGLIGEYLDYKQVGELACCIEVVEHALGMPCEQQKRCEQMQVSEIIRACFPEWEPCGVKKLDGYGKQRCFRKIK
ncbi:virulence-associated E family protein [Arabiibacter massiliensis]|uniref:virulence-associated E family protein n=1 Tax=Arabiibacter massiliensis TaxID=1870985 RepID=UPI0009BB3455|nr:virulence-associated E family protein [Arabiibacter massiliensis]